MSYALPILWHERQRFLPGILAVAFSAVLIALQYGLLLGMFSFASLLIDRTHADIWVSGPGINSIDSGSPIPESYLARVAVEPEIEQCEVYLYAFANWIKRDGAAELCLISGSRLEDNALGAIPELTPELRVRLSEPRAIVVDESSLEQLGIQGVGSMAEIDGRRVQVVGTVRGLRGFLGSRVFCSVQTARTLLELQPDQTIYLLARCHDPADAPAVVARLRARYPDLAAYTSAEFSWQTRLHWVTTARAGMALGSAALLGLLVGAAVTSQTLYAATAASQREFAVLWALGIPRRRMALLVVAQAFWVGLAGVLLALPVIFALARLADVLGVRILLSSWVLAGSGAITLVMALASSLIALRLLRLLEPGLLLH